LIGTKSNRAAISARVIISAGGLSQLDEVRGGGSHLSQNDLRLHFGLGKNSVMSIVEISWPSGAKQTFHDLAADFIYTIDEGSGIQSKQQFNQSACTNGGCSARHYPYACRLFSRMR